MNMYYLERVKELRQLENIVYICNNSPTDAISMYFIL